MPPLRVSNPMFAPSTPFGTLGFNPFGGQVGAPSVPGPINPYGSPSGRARGAFATTFGVQVPYAAQNPFAVGIPFTASPFGRPFAGVAPHGLTPKSPQGYPVIPTVR